MIDSLISSFTSDLNRSSSLNPIRVPEEVERLLRRKGRGSQGGSVDPFEEVLAEEVTHFDGCGGDHEIPVLSPSLAPPLQPTHEAFFAILCIENGIQREGRVPQPAFAAP